jgi:hypothetical protein
MVTGVLFLMLVLWVLLLAAFIYRIVTTPLTAVDAPTLIKSAAAPSAADPAAPSPWPASALSSSRSSSPCASRAGIRTPPARAPRVPPSSATLRAHTNGIGCPAAG